MRGGGEKRAIIFFTGHGLYFPTTIEKFRESVVDKDKYEWWNICGDNRIKEIANTNIFIRDVYKNWCIGGINSAINTQDKLAAKLKELVDGKEVITVGSSAGGYMALLFGILLNAKRIYTFSPQVNLHEYYKDHPFKYYEEYCQKDEISKYMDLKSLVKTHNGKIFYWYPANCEEDVRQYNSISDCSNIFFFALDQSKHGNTIWGESIIKSLCMDEEALCKLSIKYSEKIISPYQYCRDTSGLAKATLIYMGKKMKATMRKNK